MRNARVLLAAGTLAVAAACGSDGGDLSSSTVGVLVPVDPAFETTLSVDTAGGPDNYVIRSNWSPDYDPAVDPDLVIESHQVGDLETWTAASLVEGHEPSRLAFLAMTTDARSPGPDSPCTTIDADAAIVACRYDVGRADLLAATVRTSHPDVLQIVLGDQPQALDYLQGAFTTITPAEAEATYPRR